MHYGFCLRDGSNAIVCILLQFVPALVKYTMSINGLELGWIPDDCQWVVLTPSGHILGQRFPNREQAVSHLIEVQKIWNISDSSESDYTDVDFDL